MTTETIPVNVSLDPGENLPSMEHVMMFDVYHEPAGPTTDNILEIETTEDGVKCTVPKTHFDPSLLDYDRRFNVSHLAVTKPSGKLLFYHKLCHTQDLKEISEMTVHEIVLELV